MLNGFILWMALGGVVTYYILYKYKSDDTEVTDKLEEIKEIITGDIALALFGFSLMSLFSPFTIPSLVKQALKK